MDTVNTSWRRLLDDPQKHSGVYSIRSVRAPPLQG